MSSLMLWLAVVAGAAVTAGGVIALAGRGRLAIARADHQRRRLPGGHPWRHLGRLLRLRYTSGHGATSHRLDGSTSGRAVVVRLHRSASGALTEAEVQPRLPLSSELCFDLSGGAAAAAGLLSADSVLAGARRLVIGPVSVRGTLAGVASSELAGLVSELVSLCRSLEARSRAPWRLAARRYRLASQIMDEERALSGPGLTVRIREAGAPPLASGAPLPVEPGALRDPETVICARYTPQPGQLLRRRRPGDPAGRPLSQPVLDSLLYIEARSPLPERLRSPESCAVLLSVLHAWPDSVVRDGVVELRVPGRLGSELSARIAEASALASLLGEQDVDQRGHPLAR